MAIIVGDIFKPMTYDERVKPLLQYKEAYDQMDLDYSNLLSQALAWKDIANRENSPEAYEMYSRFMNDLNSYVLDFSSSGLSIGTRRGLMSMKGRYALDILPIEAAHTAMKEANDFRDKTGNDAIFEVGRYSSLDDFLHGKVANNKYESRKDVVARTAALTLAMALSAINRPEIRNALNPLFLEIIQKNGLGSIEDLQAAIAGNSAAENAFSLVKSQMIDQLGGLDRFDALGRQAIEGAIHEGMLSGIDNYKVGLEKNGAWISPAEALKLSMDERRLQIYEAQERDRVRAQAISEGRLPAGKDSEGRDVFVTSWGSWTATGQVTGDNNINFSTAKTLEGTPLKLGVPHYEYRDDAGNVYYSTNPYALTTKDGIHVTRVFNSRTPIRTSDTTDDSFESLHLIAPGEAAVLNSEGNLMGTGELDENDSRLQIASIEDIRRDPQARSYITKNNIFEDANEYFTRWGWFKDGELVNPGTKGAEKRPIFIRKEKKSTKTKSKKS